MFSQFGLIFGKLAMQLFNRAVIADFFGRTVCFLDRLFLWEANLWRRREQKDMQLHAAALFAGLQH